MAFSRIATLSDSKPVLHGEVQRGEKWRFPELPPCRTRNPSLMGRCREGKNPSCQSLTAIPVTHFHTFVTGIQIIKPEKLRIMENRIFIPGEISHGPGNKREK